jgi:deoxyribonuclease-4
MTAVFDFFAFAALIERRYSKLSHHLTSSFVDGFVNRLLIWIVKPSKKKPMRVGVHTSIAGAIENAAHHAREIGCDTFQMFSANPRGWRTLAPTVEDCERFRATRGGYALTPLVIHDNYLINLASADELTREKSIAAFRRELERALALGADFLVIHPGSAKGSTPAAAIATCIESLKQSAKDLRLNGLTILIENTAGQGSAIGRTFDEVAEIIRGVALDLPMGACIDTAHCFAAGYPIHTEAGLVETVKKLDATVGLKNVCVIHANDSKTLFSSHVDRHEHIGKGKIGAKAFGRIVRHPKLRGIPFICETPIDRPGDDKRNLRKMRELAGKL